ncbi:hypothetical protein KGQ34_03100, partial [Patescibacteria group bacterium]|nr:hypothetical protein [Patescibacteria group bacterium]
RSNGATRHRQHHNRRNKPQHPFHLFSSLLSAIMAPNAVIASLMYPAATESKKKITIPFHVTHGNGNIFSSLKLKKHCFLGCFLKMSKTYFLS